MNPPGYFRFLLNMYSERIFRWTLTILLGIILLGLAVGIGVSAALGHNHVDASLKEILSNLFRPHVPGP